MDEIGLHPGRKILSPQNNAARSARMALHRAGIASLRGEAPTRTFTQIAVYPYVRPLSRVFPMNSAAPDSLKHVHLAIARSSLATAVVVSASLPLCSLIVFFSFVLRARFSLGYWPQPNHPDPAQLAFGIHWSLAQFSLGASMGFPFWLVLVVFLSFARPTVSAVRLAALTALPWIIWLPFAYFDSGQFVSWCVD